MTPQPTIYVCGPMEPEENHEPPAGAVRYMFECVHCGEWFWDVESCMPCPARIPQAVVVSR